MRINFFLMLLVCCFQVTYIFAQKLDTSSTLTVVPFTESFDKTDDGDTDYGRIFAEKTLAAFENSRRFKTIDRTDFETIMKEIELTGEEKYKEEFKKKSPSDEALYWYGHRLKADFITTGTISSLDATIDLITGSYKSTISFSTKVINVRTNTIHIMEDFSVNSGRITKIYSSRDEAIAAALVNMVEEVKEFVDKYFPIYAKYLRTDVPNKNGEMKEVTINAGLNRGFRMGQKLDIVLINTKGLPPEDIGDAEIIDIQPNDARVKITSIKKGINIEAIPNKSEVLYFRSKAN